MILDDQILQKKAMVQHLYLGRNPPIFTEMRVFRESTDDDHLVSLFFFFTSFFFSLKYWISLSYFSFKLQFSI